MPASKRPPSWCRTDLEQAAFEIGATVAGPAADHVDREARFPAEAVGAFRAAGLLGAMVAGNGRPAASLEEMARAIRAVAYHCASSALVLAMHQIEVAYLLGHGTTPALKGVLSEVATGRLLLANANSEVGVGGDAGRSRCALEVAGGRFRLEKEALAVSYGEAADAVLVKARRSPEAAESDQVLVVCGPEGLTLTPTGTWDTVGLRGTRSLGYHLVAEGDEDMVFPEPFADIANRTGALATLALLTSVWLGLADAAAARAHAHVRGEARRTIGTTPPSALRLSELYGTLHRARDTLEATVARHAGLLGTEGAEDLRAVVELRDLKVTVTELALDVALQALAICGIAGYRRDSPESLDRILRDVLGGRIMVSNDRYLAENAFALLALREL